MPTQWSEAEQVPLGCIRPKKQSLRCPAGDAAATLRRTTQCAPQGYLLRGEHWAAFAQGRRMGFPLSLLLFQLCQHTGELLRQGTGKLHWLVGAGMEEAQAGGVEALAGEAGDGLFRAVDRVA